MGKPQRTNYSYNECIIHQVSEWGINGMTRWQSILLYFILKSAISVTMDYYKPISWIIVLEITIHSNSILAFILPAYRFDPSKEMNFLLLKFSIWHVVPCIQAATLFSQLIFASLCIIWDLVIVLYIYCCQCRRTLVLVIRSICSWKSWKFVSSIHKLHILYIYFSNNLFSVLKRV